MDHGALLDETDLVSIPRSSIVAALLADLFAAAQVDVAPTRFPMAVADYRDPRASTRLPDDQGVSPGTRPRRTRQMAERYPISWRQLRTCGSRMHSVARLGAPNAEGQINVVR